MLLNKIANRNKQRGIGLLELMLSLAIISVLLVMATRYYKSADQGQKVNNSISLITGIAGAAAQYVNAHPDTTALTIDTLVDQNYLPANFKGLKNPWGGDVQLAVSGGSVTVTFTKVFAATCKILESTLSGAKCDGTTLTVVY